MSFILLILIIITVTIILLFVIDLRIKLDIDTEKEYMEMTLLWLYPLIKIIITIEDSRPVLEFYIFKKNFFKKYIKRGKRKFSTMELVRIIAPKNIRVNTNYGFKNPSSTGITCGAINIVSQFINIESFEHSPDFLTLNDYIYLDATANVNLGFAITNIFKKIIKRRNLSWIRTQT